MKLDLLLNQLDQTKLETHIEALSAEAVIERPDASDMDPEVINRVDLSTNCKPWNFGTAALMRSLAERGDNKNG